MLPLLRYTLDLFGLEPKLAPPDKPRRQARPGAGPSRRKPSALPSPLLDAPPAAPAPEPLPALPFVPGVPLAGAIVPARFAHPKANRELRLPNAVVAYAFVRAKRKSIGFVVGPDGLVVRAPRWTPLYEVDAALHEKSAWILRKLHESQQRHTRAHSARVDWCDGACIPYLGQELRVLLDPAHAFGGKGAQLKNAPDGATAHTLLVGLPKAATPEQIRDAVQAWLMRQAQAFFQARMEHFAPLLGVRWTQLRLSSAGTRWGSASADGTIRLNWRLIHFRQSVIDYVVAHELSHLRVMNHSPSFWNTVASVVPDYQSLRAQLKDDAVPQW